MNLFYKIHLQAFNVISIVLYLRGPTFGQVLYSCQDAFVVDASDYWGHLIRHLLSASEEFPTEWFLQFWEQVKGWWAHVRTVRRVGKHLPSILTPRCRVLLEKLTGLQLVKKFPAFYGTRRFITALTSVRHLSLSWASPIQSKYTHPTSWRSILLLSTHLRLGLPSGIFPSGFPTKILYAPLSSPIRATCPAHPILLDFITHTILGEEYRSLI